MNKKIEGYLTKHYYELVNIAKKITKNHNLHQDLLHFVVVELYEKEKIILKSYDDNSIRYYITAIMRINWYSKTSPFYYKVKKEIDKYQDISDFKDDVIEGQYDFEKEEILGILEVEWSELDWFKKSLFQMYMELGSINKVAKKTTIPKTSVSNYLKQGRNQIKENIYIELKKRYG